MRGGARIWWRRRGGSGRGSSPLLCRRNPAPPGCAAAPPPGHHFVFAFLPLSWTFVAVFVATMSASLAFFQSLFLLLDVHDDEAAVVLALVGLVLGVLSQRCPDVL